MEVHTCDPNTGEAEARDLPGGQGLLVIVFAWVNSKTLYQEREGRGEIVMDEQQDLILRGCRDHHGLLDPVSRMGKRGESPQGRFGFWEL